MATARISEVRAILSTTWCKFC